MSSRLHAPRSKRAATAPSSFRPDRPDARGHDGRHEGRKHGQDKRRPSRRPRRLAPGFDKEGRHGTRARARTEARAPSRPASLKARPATRAPMTAWPRPCTTATTDRTSRSRPPPRAVASRRRAYRHTTWTTTPIATTWCAGHASFIEGPPGAMALSARCLSPLKGRVEFAPVGARENAVMQSCADPSRRVHCTRLLVRAAAPAARTQRAHAPRRAQLQARRS